MTVTNTRFSLAASALALGLALAGCNRANELQGNQQAGLTAEQDQTASLPALPATLPMTAGNETQPTYAPAAAALPAAPRIRTVRVADTSGGADYAYADDAYGYADAIGDAPPDYGFDYDGVEPWAWQGYDGSIAYAEPIDDGYRYYYYRAGADEPYYVQDPDYGYGYDNGQLAVIYAAGGAILPYADYGPRYDYAGRYLYRGRALYRASRINERRAVIAANWAARRDRIDALRARWAGYRNDRPDWRTYHQRYAEQRERHWQPENWRRQADARRFADWRHADFRTPPPPRAIPVAWQKARWARDNRHYAPAAAAIAAAQGRREDRGAIADIRQQRRQAVFDRRQVQAGQPGPGDFRPGQRPDPAAAEQFRAQRQIAREQRDTLRQQREQPGQLREQRAQAAQARDAQRTARIEQRRASAQPDAQRVQARQAQAQQRQERQAQRQQLRDQRRDPGARQAEARAADRARPDAQRGQERAAARGQAIQARQAQRAEQSQARAQAQQSRLAGRMQAQQARAASRAPAQRAEPQSRGGGRQFDGGAPGGGAPQARGGGGQFHGGGAPGGGAPRGGGNHGGGNPGGSAPGGGHAPGGGGNPGGDGHGPGGGGHRPG